MEKVNVLTETEVPQEKGQGLFARVFMEHFPLIPVEDERRLNDPGIRENFLERVFGGKQGTSGCIILDRVS